MEDEGILAKWRAAHQDILADPTNYEAKQLKGSVARQIGLKYQHCADDLVPGKEPTVAHTQCYHTVPRGIPQTNDLYQYDLPLEGTCGFVWKKPNQSNEGGAWGWSNGGQGSSVEDPFWHHAAPSTNTDAHGKRSYASAVSGWVNDLMPEKAGPSSNVPLKCGKKNMLQLS